MGVREDYHVSSSVKRRREHVDDSTVTCPRFKAGDVEEPCGNMHEIVGEAARVCSL
jgi:hypothetical protein